MENLMWALSLIGLLSSSFNTLFFLHYRSHRRRRLIGARVLGVLSLGLALESLYFLLWASTGALSLGLNNLMMVRLPVPLGSGLISILILRQVLAGTGS
jgi:hypothetical protein